MKFSLVLSIVVTIFVFNFPLIGFAQPEQNEFLIASWNLLNFGQSRADVDENLQTMVEIMAGSNYFEIGSDYDLIFVQELRSDGIAFDNLCNEYLVELNYTCLRTSQLSGTGSNDESYGVIFSNNLDVIVEDTSDETVSPHIPQGTDQSSGEMVRPPMKATVTFPNGLEFVVYNNHIKPGDPETRDELAVLQNAINSHHGVPTGDKIIVLGDLNADGKPAYHPDGTRCGSQYLVGGFENHFGLFDRPNWHRLFSISNYTNFASNPCSYDKIIPNDKMALLFTGDYGIVGTLPDGTSFGRYPDPGFKAGGKHISDHKLIWAKFSYALEPQFVNGVTEEMTENVDTDTTDENELTENGNGGGCLIATASFGSEMAPQVQFLREIRDNSVMSTQSGASFMTAFNAFYYSFSPAVADLERQNPMFKEIVKVAITPLISSLSLLQYVDIDSEEEMLGYGVGIMLMNVGLYFVAPAVTIVKVGKLFKK